jgi:hypothetical protein
MAKGPLPDPQWSQSASVCIACGYSLQGLPTRGQCPECGAGYEDFQLVLYGVPRATHRPGLRRVIWAALITLCVIHLYTLIIQIVFRPMLALMTSVILGGGVVAMLVTGPRERRVTERFIVTKGGIARVAMKFDPAARRLDTIFVVWGNADAVDVQRLSLFWKRLRVGNQVEGRAGRMRDVIFDAGFRCPDADTERVRDAIHANMTGSVPPAQKPPLGPPFPAPASPPPSAASPP